MKKTTFLLILIAAFVSCHANSDNQVKRYQIKSGIVKYETTIYGKMMGSTITGSGTEELYFKNWGITELKEEKSTQTTVIKIFGKGKTETTSEHTIAKLDNGESYIVDFKNETISVGRDRTMDMLKRTDTSAEDAGKSMIESMGGKRIGDETYKGYNCEVWTIAGGKQWNYKGVMLKMEITVLGIKTQTEATSIKFDVSVPDANFKLPDFKIQKTESLLNTDEFDYEMDKGMDEDMKKVQNLSFQEWKKMVVENDPEMKGKSDEELHQTYDMMQKMIKFMK